VNQYPLVNRNLRGMSLVELLLALLLGTLVVASAIGIFVANRKTMLTAQGVGQMQQNLQLAMALLARDIRQAGGNPCSRNLPLANLLDNPSAHWWSDLASVKRADDTWSVPWRKTLRGLTTAEFASGTRAGARVAGSDAIELLSAESDAVTVVSDDGSRFVLNTASHGFSSGNLLLVCDLRQASLFQTEVSGANVRHPANMMNCSAPPGLPGGCDVEPFVYAPHALIARWNPLRWYLGHNGRGGTSLYRMTLDGNGQGVTRQEMVEDISALTLRYLLAGHADPLGLPALAGRWEEVMAVRIELGVVAADLRADDGAPLTRTAVQVVNLRNRSP